MSKTPETVTLVERLENATTEDLHDYAAVLLGQLLSEAAAAIRSLESRLAEANERAERAERERDIARKGIAAVDRLICSSRGVVGLHLNGDEAPWEELLPPGHFCEWLEDFDAARGKK